MKVNIPIHSNEASIVAAWNTMPDDERHQKVRLTFAHPVSLNTRKRRCSEPKLVHEYRLFVSTKNNLCYTNTTRTGFVFGAMDLQALISIEPVPKVDLVKKVGNMANRFHQNAWGDLKAKLIADPAKYADEYGYSVTNITGKFPAHVIEAIKSAFESKTDYSYRQDSGVFLTGKQQQSCWGGTSNRAGRDLKVECKLCDDGIFRAWFTSEFNGCLNGDYWVLINPTTAIFKERD